MPTFSTGSGTGSTYATVLLTFPDADWFRHALMGALDEMTNPANWFEDGDVGVSFATEEAIRMIESYIFMGFNPIPVGLVHAFANAAVPDGYLLCDGGSYVASDWPELFAAIGYTFGGSGANFSVPNLTDSVIVGTDGSFVVGDTGGETTHTLDISQIPAHNHIDSGHSHTIPLVTSLPAQAGVGFAGDVTVPVITNLTGVGFASIQNTGGGLSHNNMQPYLALSYCIYAGR